MPPYIPDRTKHASRLRWYNLCTTNAPRYKPAKGSWTKEEEQPLIDLRKADKSWIGIWKALGDEC